MTTRTGTHSLEGKVVVVTGAAQGIGAGYARRLVAEGCRVVLADRNADAVHATAASLTGPGKATAAVLDVADPGSGAELAAFVGEEHGRLDGLINNAAVFSTITRKPFWEITSEEWDQVITVNLKGPWLVTSALLPLLRRSESASVINVGSDAVLMGRSGYLHYVASKGGVQGMTYSMAHELGQFGIRVNTLSPGPVYTEIARTTVSPEQKRAMTDAQALQRAAEPDDMVGLAAFLLSDDSAYITGQTISVNGGLIHR
ncbi:SDR family NAD(P)-dependent oxidoreductase [Streptomyces rugosispiralis]|uniref:Glucose 1-dehydrogenase n=1 Tax=Streptomyces rugosispiralis TaxID=2967341 RepID=A0ABT1URW5_9ACTN|nr:glucose 1-dehydrogenase [Streptomyces rugosispiralis]MCQ8187871.1 glucose 1-dehydrogenase [Streptomyces rugosispiralis]